jgi:hypothetical protein
LQKLHFSSLNHLSIHQCSSSSLYPLQSPTAQLYLWSNTQISLKSLSARDHHQCTNLSQISPFKDDHPMHKSVKSLFREHHHPYTNLTNLIEGSSSGMHKAVSLFLRSIFFPYPWWCLAPA